MCMFSTNYFLGDIRYTGSCEKSLKATTLCIMSQPVCYCKDMNDNYSWISLINKWQEWAVLVASSRKEKQEMSMFIGYAEYVDYIHIL